MLVLQNIYNIMTKKQKSNFRIAAEFVITAFIFIILLILGVWKVIEMIF